MSATHDPLALLALSADYLRAVAWPLLPALLLETGVTARFHYSDKCISFGGLLDRVPRPHLRTNLEVHPVHCRRSARNSVAARLYNRFDNLAYVTRCASVLVSLHLNAIGLSVDHDRPKLAHGGLFLSKVSNRPLNLRCVFCCRRFGDARWCGRLLSRSTSPNCAEQDDNGCPCERGSPPLHDQSSLSGAFAGSSALPVEFCAHANVGRTVLASPQRRERIFGAARERGKFLR
jgi:hypothetical protein